MTDTPPPTSAYDALVRSFDHSDLAGLPAYAKFRAALNELAHQLEAVPLAVFLEAIRDMAVTTPYGDTCNAPGCDTRPLAFPHKVERAADWLKGTYRCGDCGTVWTCGYAADFMIFFS
jgi:hypothetical protein